MIGRHRPGLVFLVAAMAAFAACQSESTPEPGVDVVATVGGGTALRTIEPGLVFGANFGAWVSNTRLGTSTRDLVKVLRPSVGRFPGGNISNNFCWETQKVSGNDHLVWEDWSWGTDVAQYLAFLKGIGAVPMFSLMPFDHTIGGQPHSAVSEAAALAQLFVAEGFTGAYYEVGNENDGSWNPMLSVNEYTDRFVLLVRAVKAVDPTARSMGPVVSSYNMTWITGFLDRLAALGETGLLDWISYHHYGGWISNGNEDMIDLNDPQDLGEELQTVRSALASRGLGRVRIAVNELNAAIWDTGCTRDQFTIKQGLWLADALGVSLVGADAANVWIHLHPGTDPHALIDSEATPRGAADPELLAGGPGRLVALVERSERAGRGPAGRSRHGDFGPDGVRGTEGRPEPGRDAGQQDRAGPDRGRRSSGRAAERRGPAPGLRGVQRGLGARRRDRFDHGPAGHRHRAGHGRRRSRRPLTGLPGAWRQSLSRLRPARALSHDTAPPRTVPQMRSITVTMTGQSLNVARLVRS
jgi:hypothetical protein